MNSLSKRIDNIIEEKSLLKHPFYQMWSDGKLSADSLAGYSKEYFQMVKAVPGFVETIASFAPESLVTEIRENQAEEAEHLNPWISFAASLGVNSAEITIYSGLEKTNDSVCRNSTAHPAMYARSSIFPTHSAERSRMSGLILLPPSIAYLRGCMNSDCEYSASSDSSA